MANQNTLSTSIDPDVKKALNLYCKRRGLKLRHVVEQAIIEQIEDQLDLDTFRLRRDEETISLDQLLSELPQDDASKVRK